MSVKNLKNGGCGCSSGPSLPSSELQMVPAGTMILQAPCPEGGAPKSSSSVSEVLGGGNPTSDCASLQNPWVLQNFDAVALGKPGTMFARCASAWAVPGAILYFPGIGFLEVLGASGDVVTYRNVTIEPGTQVLAGTSFLVGPPQPPTVLDDDGESSEWQDASVLDAIYGVEGNVPKKIVPGNGTILYGCGGKWQRRQAGLMFYPTTRTSLVSYNGAAANKTWTPALPNKPTKPSCSLGLWAQLAVHVNSSSTVSNLYPTNSVAVNGRTVAVCHAHPSFHHQFNDVMIDTLDQATITVEGKKAGSNGGMKIEVELLGYWY